MRYALLGLWFFSAPLAAGSVAHVEVEHRADGRYAVRLNVGIAAPAAKVRALLTDYAHLSRINPAVKKSEILARLGPGAYRVRTVIKACVWFFCVTLRQVQDVTQRPNGDIVAVTLPAQSNFSYGRARWRVHDEHGGTRVSFDAQLQPSFWVPPLIGPWIIERKLRSEALETAARLEKLTVSRTPP